MPQQAYTYEDYGKGAIKSDEFQAKFKEILEKYVKNEDPNFSLFTVTNSELDNYKSILTTDEIDLFEGNISNRDILVEALALLKSGNFQDSALGNLLNQHQDNLRDKL